MQILSDNNRVKFRKFYSAEDPGLKKYSFVLRDFKSVEAVLIPHGKYFSLCVSCSVGCPIHCRFCSTGGQQFQRFLTSEEIVNQLTTVLEDDFEGDLKVVSFMGMGEPCLNLDNVIHASKRFAAEWGIDRILLSTIGIPGGIREIANNLDVELYLSIVSPFDRIRSFLVPYRPYHSVAALFDVLKEYNKITKKPVNISYLLLDNVNDRKVDIRTLTGGLKKQKLEAIISLREFCPNDSLFRSSKRMHSIAKEIELEGIRTEIFVSKGKDVFGGCGQLKQFQS